MAASSDDHRWLYAAAALALRGRPASRPNPSVGAILVKDGIVVGRGWTRPGGRPHAEAVALAQAGDAARGATAYVSLEPCAHQSPRGPRCSDLLVEAGVARAVIGVLDPDPRTAGDGIARMEAGGIGCELAECMACRASLAGYLSQREKRRPFVTLKLALTADGFIARSDGASKWITGEEARAHAHVERAMSDAILVGGGTLRADDPKLGVRLEGLEQRSPERWVLTRGAAPEGWRSIDTPDAISRMSNIQYLFVEGGAQTAASLLEAGLVDRLLVYRAPIEFGEGIPAFSDPAPDGVPAGWKLADRRQLGSDTLSIYERG